MRAYKPKRFLRITGEEGKVDVVEIVEVQRDESEKIRGRFDEKKAIEKLLSSPTELIGD